ncbi:MAG TPA: hypothetical protein VG186_13915 [Solirubrobacteraceae bacterium]|nr:hypothetical protein [Solirubrobacteraceae bacterium]
MRRWWATGVGALATLCTLVPAVTAVARTTRVVNVTLVGSLTIAWQGEEVHGCAAEGLCGVSGSLQMLPSGESSGGPGPPPIELVDQYSAARVTDTLGGAAPGTTCADVVPIDFYFAIVHASPGGLEAVVKPADSFQLPSAGRCAGPTASDLAALTLPARKLGSHGYDLTGTTTFSAGPFTVTATSTVHAVFGGNGGTISGLVGTSTLSSGSLGVGRAPTTGPIHTALDEHAEVAYRIASVTGALSTTFAGLPAPYCAPLGACGTSGALSDSFAATGVVIFSADRIVKHRVGARRALADLRAGRLAVFDSWDGIPFKEAITEKLSGPGAATCSDGESATEFAAGTQRGGRHTLRLGLASAAAGQGGTADADPLRTRCPGPSSTDVAGTSPLARATISTAGLGAHRMTIAFRSGGSFSSGAYQGTRAGSVVVALVLAHASGGTRHVRTGSSIPPLP